MKPFGILFICTIRAFLKIKFVSPIDSRVTSVLLNYEKLEQPCMPSLLLHCFSLEFTFSHQLLLGGRRVGAVPRGLVT